MFNPKYMIGLRNLYEGFISATVGTSSKFNVQQLLIQKLCPLGILIKNHIQHCIVHVNTPIPSFLVELLRSLNQKFDYGTVPTNNIYSNYSLRK